MVSDKYKEIMSLQTITSTSGVFCGCCANVLTLEALVNVEPDIANLITFLHFLFISVEGFIFTKNFGTIASSIPVKEYAILVALYFVSTVLNNFAYTLHVPVILHIIIRSGSLPTTLIVGFIVKGRRPPIQKVAGALLVAAGVILATIGGAKTAQETQTNVSKWSIGVALLVGGQIAGALTGLRQETLYHQYGSHPDEMLYYTHILPLPAFLPVLGSLYETLSSVNEKWFYGIGWILIVANVFTQYVCVRSVHGLASNFTVLTVNLVLTVRKFISLSLSVLLFDNIFSIYHWCGSVLLFLGTAVYFNFFQKMPVENAYKKDKSL